MHVSVLGQAFLFSTRPGPSTFPATCPSLKSDPLTTGVLREIELTDRDVEDILGHMFVDVTNDPLGLVPEATLPVRPAK